MDGFLLLEKIKQKPELASIPIVMLSSSGPVEAARARALGAALTLNKPIKQADLLEGLSKALSAPPVESVQSLPPSDPSGGSRPSSLRILLVEDNAVNRRFALRTLEKLGHRVAVAFNGRQALTALYGDSMSQQGDESTIHLTRLAPQPPFDLVLMDVQMPEMDGLEATAFIRAREQMTGHHLPIVAMTAHAMSGDRDRCLAAGMDDYLTKPVLLADLSRVLDKLVPTTTRSHCAAVTEPAPAASPAQSAGEESWLSELVPLFLQECPRFLTEIRAAIARGDAEGLHRAAHTFKGSLTNFSAPEAVEAAQSLAMIGRQGNLAEAEGAYAALEGTVAQLRESLMALLKDKKLVSEVT
jgi:CheY-like chemotaxis protein/HPt (histidine-containing phosphotransfer) domain-containing protein